MKIPLITMLFSGLFWLLMVTVLRPVSGDKSPAYPEFWQWAVEICRIVFAASVLIVLWANMTERAF